MAPVGKLTSVRQALHYRLGQLVLVPTRRVAWPDINFVPVIGETYLQPTFHPNTTGWGGVGAGAPRRHRGLYQINVKGPIATGSETGDEIADLIIEHFLAVPTIAQFGARVRIGSFDGALAVPSRASAITDGAWRIVPVTIPWWCDTF